MVIVSLLLRVMWRLVSDAVVLLTARFGKHEIPRQLLAVVVVLLLLVVVVLLLPLLTALVGQVKAIVAEEEGPLVLLVGMTLDGVLRQPLLGRPEFVGPDKLLAMLVAMAVHV